jgi:hypothetical protein
MASVLIAVVPSQVAAEVFCGKFTGEFFISGGAACGVSGFLLPHIGPPGIAHPTQVSGPG